jgi:hypothetical protein
MLSPDFVVEIAYFNYDPSASHSATVKDTVRSAVHGVAAAFPPLRDQIEAVIRLKARTRWLIEQPGFL